MPNLTRIHESSLMNYGMSFVTLYRRQGSRPSPWKRNAKRQNGCLGRPYKYREEGGHMLPPRWESALPSAIPFPRRGPPQCQRFPEPAGSLYSDFLPRRGSWDDAGGVQGLELAENASWVYSHNTLNITEADSGKEAEGMGCFLAVWILPPPGRSAKGKGGQRMVGIWLAGFGKAR